MKKFIKNILCLILILFLIGYIYDNRDKTKEMIATLEIYTKAITVSEYEYTEEFKINDIKVSTNNFYYNKLNENQKKIYTSLANGIRELKKEIILKNYEYVDNQTSLDDIEIVFNYFCLDHPEVFYLNNSYIVSNVSSLIGNNVIIEVEYSVESLEELEYKVEKINEVIDIYLKDAKNVDKVDSEIILHDRLAQDVKYYEYEKIEDIPSSCHTIEGAFLNKEAVCDGLSKALQVLLSNVEIKNIVVLGKLEETPHAWNMVKLDDKWYNLDITSNKSIKLENDENIVIHVYFNVSDEEIISTHEFTEKDILPVSNELDEKYNYYIHTKKYIKTGDNFKKELSNIISMNQNEYILEFYTEDMKNASKNIYETLLLTNKDEYLKNNQFIYYNILNTYIIVKNR